MMNYLRHVIIAGLSVALVGCLDGSSNYQDLDQYIADMKSRPRGNIEPLPLFRPYEIFTYGASAKRSPFDPPIKISLNQSELNSNIKPDPARVKEYLEQFEVDSFSMVGSISNDDGLWGLVRTTDGVHRVKVGDYLGRNHGRIVFVDGKELRLMEIVPAGPGFWTERPRSLHLNE